MIGFIGASLQLQFQLKSLITAHSRWLTQAPSVSFLDYERLPFHCVWLVNFLRLTNSSPVGIKSFLVGNSTDPNSESESYITTDGQSASPSWNKAPIWGLRLDFYYCQLRVCWCGALSLTRERICRLQLLLVLASAVIFGSEPHLFYCLIFETSLFVASYYSQGYGGGIQPNRPDPDSRINSLFITFRGPCRSHLLQGFYSAVYICVVTETFLITW
jgi:hypothetical protein